MSKPPALPHHLRIAALQCNFEGGEAATLALPARWQELGFNVEQLFHTHSEKYNAVYRADLHAPLLRRYVDECRQHGLRILLYMNCHILLDSQAERSQDWAQVDRQGQFHRPYGTYYASCLNASWAEFFLDSIRQLGEFDLAGIFLDGPTASDCFCPACQNAYRAAHGGTLAEATPAQVAAFTVRSRIAFTRRVYETVKAVNPNWLMYVNAGILHGGETAAEVAAMLQVNDLIGTEGGFQFYGPAKDVDLWHCGLSARALDAVAGDKRKVIFMAGDHKPWSWYLHTPAETRLCYASGLANGASVWYGIHCSSDNLHSAAGDAAREMLAFDRKHARLYERTESLADVAVFHSFETAKHYTTTAQDSDLYRRHEAQAAAAIGNYGEAFQGAYGIAFRSGQPCDLVTELNLAALSRYAVVLLPTTACMSAATVAAIRDYVSGGGVVIADSQTSLFDAVFAPQADFQLAEVLGVSVAGYQAYNMHDYFRFRAAHDPFAGEGVQHLPAPGVAVKVRPAADAEVLAELCPPLAGRYSGKPETPVLPFVIGHRFGRGYAYYLAGTFFQLYRAHGIVHYRRFIQGLLARHGKPVARVSGLPESVEVTVRRVVGTDTILVHLVNYTGGMTRPIDTVTPVRGATLHLAQAAAKVRALVAGRTLRPRADGLLPLPDLHTYEVIRVDGV